MVNYIESAVWEYFQPNPEEMYTINIFDDGNNQYEHYENKWLLFGKWRGKYAIVNRASPNIKINSISQWKLRKVFE
jgi:hypothetical protein